MAFGAEAAAAARGMVVASMHQHVDKTAMHSPSPSELSACEMRCDKTCRN
jgi:hypothetical protein